MILKQLETINLVTLFVFKTKLYPPILSTYIRGKKKEKVQDISGESQAIKQFMKLIFFSLFICCFPIQHAVFSLSKNKIK